MTFLYTVKQPSELKNDLSNLQAECQLWYPEDLTHYERGKVGSLRVNNDNVKAALSSRFDELVRETINKRIKVKEELGGSTDSGGGAQKKNREITKDVVVNRGKYAAFYAKPYPIEIKTITLPEKNRYETSEEHEIRLEDFKRQQKIEYVYATFDAPKYNFENEGFRPYSFCDRENRRRLGFKGTGSYEAENAFGAKRKITKREMETRVHRIERKFEGYDIFKAVFGKAVFPYKREDAKRLGELEIVCVAEFLPEWPESFSDYSNYTRATYSDPYEDTESVTKLQAYAYSWSLVEKGTNNILVSVPLNIDPKSLAQDKETETNLRFLDNEINRLRKKFVR